MMAMCLIRVFPKNSFSGLAGISKLVGIFSPELQFLPTETRELWKETETTLPDNLPSRWL